MQRAMRAGMRRASLWFLLLAPALSLSCAYGKRGYSGGGDRGAGGRGDPSSEGDHEGTPGSPDPGAGAGPADDNPDGDGDPTSGGDDNPDGDGDGGGDPGDGGDPGGDAPGCLHDPCAAGVALDATCDPCVADTCAADPYCCSTQWDTECVAQATSCGCSGGGGSGGSGGSGGGGGGSTCAHDPCLPGGPLEASCSPCASAVCGDDPFCCTTEWDLYCVLAALQVCSGCF